ncbi:MAG TPA: CHAT domain-containing protein, partial [Bryobacteraceae bacterium]
MPARIVWAVLLFLQASCLSAVALDLNQAIERCRNTVGKPIIVECMRNGGTLQTCRAGAGPRVKACVQSAMLASRPKAELFDPAKAAGSPKPEDVAAEAALLANKVPAGLVAPPRKASEMTAILDQQAPDPSKIAELTAAADASVPAGLKSTELAAFYYKRGVARTQLGRNDEALADAELAVGNMQGADYPNVGSRYEQLLIARLRDAGQNQRAKALLSKQVVAFSSLAKGKLFGLNLALAVGKIRNGDINSAETYVTRNRALLLESQRWPNFAIYGMSWQAIVEDGNARVAEARGRYAEAESSYHKAALLYAATVKTLPKWQSKPPDGQFERSSDWALALEGRAKVTQGRIGEGEADVRRALLNRLSNSGKFSADTGGILSVLVYVLQEQGRYREAEQLQRQVIGIFQGLGYGVDSAQMIAAQVFLAQILNLERRYDDASRLYDQIDAWTAKWEPSRREAVNGSLARVSVMLAKGNNEDALDIAQHVLERERTRSGSASFNTATARGFVAMALARKGKTAEALQAFNEALPILLSKFGGGADEDSGSTAAARDARVRFIVEAYMRILALNPSLAPADVANTTFAYADVLRGPAVQRALQASFARAAVNNPDLARLVRSSQDSEKQIGAAVGALNNLLAQLPSERDEKAIKATQIEIETLKAARAQTLADLAKRFPSYGNLINPARANAVDLQSQLSEDEALLSFYFGQFDSFVWVVSKARPVNFARINTTFAKLNRTVTKLREALDPKATLISDIPAFDLKLASELYDQLLKPIERDWKSAKSLIVVTNGALGLLPLSLLPTAPTNINTDAEPLFAGYRDVPWLARTHAVTMVPSASALETLRKLPPGGPDRRELVAFGDPYFSKEEADEAEQERANPVVADASTTTRGKPLQRRNSPDIKAGDHAELALLPRLPDTADELKSIALALKSDPSKVLNLGKDANEQAVKTMNLSRFKIVAFATHGLIPGELDGLTQPALALSAPSLTGTDGDGLLTMEEILSLKLDADWVILSACNTGAGAGAGAEAVSGLGRAFFYAGT